MTLRTAFRTSWLMLLAFGFPFCAHAGAPNVQQIVQRSVAANQADWQAAPNYAFTEHDVETKRGGDEVIKTYQVIMVNGSPYNRLIAIDNKPLSPAQNEQEERKMRQEAIRRQHESPAQRSKRIAKYQRERHQDHQMMNEMAAAFEYRLAGEATLDGFNVYILDATPKPGYTPHTRETKVLTGMRGRLWIDKASYQWVKVVAEVTKPVEFGMFIAKVSPGTRFELEQRPVENGSVWLPVHFSMNVNASVLGMFSENSTDDETYSHYEPNRVVIASLLK